ncbi:MAG: glycosyltransferase family 2 protein [Thermoplasmatales archaeon]|nr:glycosyltransferase family 2 protein [Thermoplasmatales archaeon]
MELFKISLGEWAPEGGEALYVRPEGDVSVDGGALTLGKGARVSLDTYFNSFSSGKYDRYTVVEEVTYSATVSGNLAVRLHEVRGGSERTVGEKRIVSDEPTEVSFGFEIAGLADGAPARHYVSFEALDASIVHDAGGFHCDAIPGDVSMAAVICTFNREPHVKETLSRIRGMLEDPGYGLDGEIQVIVVDNGRSLSDSWEGHPDMALLPNRNLGGSGGFARGMLEAIGRGRTHTLLMDDDETVDPNVLYKTLNLLRVLKDEYRDAQILGGMLLNDDPAVQYEAGSRNLRRLKGDLDFRGGSSLAENESEEPIDYGAWWYLCFPTSLAEDNLPMPFFIRVDDVEFGLRNPGLRIVMNGIGVWHDRFEGRANKAVEHYYTERNTLYLWSMHGVRPHPFAVRYWYKTIYLALSSNYDSLRIFRQAVEDYLDGIGFLETVDGEANHGKISEMAQSPRESTLLGNGLGHMLGNLFSKRFFGNVLESLRLFIRYLRESGGARFSIRHGWGGLVTPRSWEKRFFDDARDQDT